MCTKDAAPWQHIEIHSAGHTGSTHIVFLRTGSSRHPEFIASGLRLQLGKARHADQNAWSDKGMGGQTVGAKYSLTALSKQSIHA